jgi:hypothetical protein
MKGQKPDAGRVNRIENGKMIQNELKHIRGKSLPYYTCDTLGGERELASMKFVPDAFKKKYSGSNDGH